jgi:uncharacterized protein (DUF433 family)
MVRKTQPKRDARDKVERGEKTNLSRARVMVRPLRSSAKNGKDNGDVIVKLPGVCGGRAIIAGSRMPVWGLEVARRAGRSDRSILEMYPSVTKPQLLAAWKWVKSHKAEIEYDIAENEKA